MDEKYNKVIQIPDRISDEQKEEILNHQAKFMLGEFADKILDKGLFVIEYKSKELPYEFDPYGYMQTKKFVFTIEFTVPERKQVFIPDYINHPLERISLDDYKAGEIIKNLASRLMKIGRSR